MLFVYPLLSKKSLPRIPQSAQIVRSYTSGGVVSHALRESRTLLQRKAAESALTLLHEEDYSASHVTIS